MTLSVTRFGRAGSGSSWKRNDYGLQNTGRKSCDENRMYTHFQPEHIGGGGDLYPISCSPPTTKDLQETLHTQYMHTHTCTHTHTHTHTYTHIHVHTHTNMHSHAAHTHTHIYIYSTDQRKG